MSLTETVQVMLSRCEALVLFDWLASLDAMDLPKQLDPAQQNVLWRLEGQLESSLPEVVAADYQERLSAAKIRVLSNEGG